MQMGTILITMEADEGLNRFIGAPIKENTIWANEKQLQNRIPIT